MNNEAVDYFFASIDSHIREGLNSKDALIRAVDDYAYVFHNEIYNKTLEKEKNKKICYDSKNLSKEELNETYNTKNRIINKKYYFITFRRKRYNEDEWKYANDVIDISLCEWSKIFNNKYGEYYILFAKEITKEEYEKYKNRF